MKVIQMLLFWPVVFGFVWYFISFQVAVIMGLVYVHAMILLLIYITDNLTKVTGTQAKLTDDALDRLHTKLMDEIDSKLNES